VPDEVRPRHVAIIADGNRRWARERGLPVLAGHIQGIEAIRPILRRARDRGVETLSVYTFSTENWNRPEDEVAGLFGLIDGAVRQYTDELITEGVRVQIIGRLHEAPSDVQRSIRSAEERTARGTRMELNICFNYSGRAEIVDAAARFGGGTEEEFAKLLYAPEMHDPDLIIRTSGEQRMSNYLLWQSAYSELIFADPLWPDFSREDFRAALDLYAGRARRFGGR